MTESGDAAGCRRVSVLAIGGTIAMTGAHGRAVKPSLSADDVLAAVPAIGEVAQVTARSVASLPGPHLDLALIDRVAQEVEAEFATGADGVVVTQGTDTIEESAFALELMLGAVGPVVVTGAMRPPGTPGADGPINLLQAVEVAASTAAREFGTCVLMDGVVAAPRFVTKAHTTSVHAFDAGPVQPARVIEGRVTPLATLPPLPAVGWRHGMAPGAVALLPATLGDAGALIDCLPRAGYAGLVIAGMGGGHVHPDMVPRSEAFGADHPVVIASRTGGGSTTAQSYGYAGAELDLARVGAIRAGWLSPLKARIALALLLGAGATGAGIRDFYAAVDGG